LRLGRGAAALADLQAASSMPGDANFRIDVAAAWIEAKRPIEALECLGRSLRESPTGRVYELQARALALQGDFRAARSAAQQALAAQPDNAGFQELLEQLNALIPPSADSP
jgi:tetratricopeptide (TPR) repeat protein